MSVPMRWENCLAPATPETAPPLRRRRPSRKARGLRQLIAFVLIASATGLLSTAAWNSARPLLAEPTLRQITVASQGRQVAVNAATVERRLGYVTITGSILNRTGRSLPRAEVMVELLDAGNRTVRVESALAAYDPVPANEAAPFQVDLPDDSRAVSYRASARQLSGRRLD